MLLSDLAQRVRANSRARVYYLEENSTRRFLDFADLAAQAATLRENLNQRGLRSSHRVGIIGSNSVEWIVWELALTSIGCATVAVPEEVARESGSGLLEEYDLSILFILREDRGKWNCESSRYTAWLEDRAAVPLDFRPGAPDPLFALSFSSGSTGRIKCQVISKEGVEAEIANFYQQFRGDHRLTRSDRVLLFLPQSNYQQRMLTYAALYHGVSLAVARTERTLEAFKTLRPTVCLAPPALYDGVHARYLLAVEMLPRRKRTILQTVRKFSTFLPDALGRPVRKLVFRKIHVSFGGRLRVCVAGMAPIRMTTLEFFEEIGLQIYEAYGMTEVGVIAANTPTAHRIGSVGRPVRGTEVILAADAEILVRRKAVISTYYRDPRATAALFGDDGLLRTGDVGHFDKDGFLFLAGRKKELIITSQGQKVHPERFEAIINRCPSVGNSVVFGDGKNHLVALISLRDKQTAAIRKDVEAAIADANRQLGGTTQIAKTAITEEQFSPDNFLLTKNFKLNRRAIEERFSVELFGRQTFSGRIPGSIDGQMLAVVSAAWTNAFALPCVPLDANFFDLGGDSLVAAKIIQFLQATVPDLQAKDVLDAPTIELMAARLGELKTGPRFDVSTA